MIIFRFTAEDVLRTRFAISPLFEATASLVALRDPARASVHLPWVRRARERTANLDLRLLHRLVPDRGYTPDFISPPPSSPLPDLADEIARVRATPPAQVRRELAWRFEGARPPRVELDDLADTLARYWQAALEPEWERLRDALEADIAQRARALTGAGALEVFGDLHPDIRWRDGALEVDRGVQAEVELGGRGLLLMPSAFIWPRCGAMYDPPWQPAVIYPPRGIGHLWAPPRRDPRALEALLGARRARILAALDRPATTTDLARRLHASAAGVSEHLAVLRAAGLVRSQREGREVHYARTPTGDALLREGLTPR